MVKTGPFDHKMTHLTSKTKKKFDSLFDHQSGQKMTHLAIKTRNLRKFSMVKSGPFDHKSGQKMTHLTIKNKELRKFSKIFDG